MLLWFKDALLADSLLQRMPLTPSGVLLWGGPCRDGDTSAIADFVAEVADPYNGPSRITLAEIGGGVGLNVVEATEDDFEAFSSWFEKEISTGSMRIGRSEADVLPREEIEP
ncbi:MAG: hypothetical protein BWY06_02802 [Candidatus Latescibacteria bacterium ADurb.Bin168]|nr:MAG: hypothetical protein BWY06_02802 [Candidatus Latescibacteria bacterium ADurb.Bin168]